MRNHRFGNLHFNRFFLDQDWMNKSLNFKPVLWGSRNADELVGGVSNELLIGRQGDDLLKGGGGYDLVFGGRGKDKLIFEAALNEGSGSCFKDKYDGGRGRDTLVLQLTSGEWSDPEILSEIVAFLDHIEGGAAHRYFTFDSLNLRVKSLETLEVYVDGILIEDPRDPEPENVVVDLGGSTEDEMFEPGGDANYDVITGTGNDIVTTGSGNDIISTGSGNDVVYPGGGSDFVNAGPGNDTIIGGTGAGDDVYDGGSGTDTVIYESDTAGVTVFLDEADRSGFTSTDFETFANLGDLLVDKGLVATTPTGVAYGPDINVDALIGIENVRLGSGSDAVTGNDSDNLLDGAGGDDSLNGLGGNDNLRGGAGTDAIDGGGGEDVITGGSGDDQINGGVGYDAIVLSGNSTDYAINSIGDGFYTIAGPDGTDTVTQVESIVFDDGTFGLWSFVGPIDIFLSGSNDIYDGSGARERIFGLAGDDQLSGGQEEDDFIGGAGNDVMDGGGLNDPLNLDDQNFVWDSVSYDREYDEAIDAGFTASGVSVNFETGVATDVYGDTDTLIEIERVYATKADDTLVGSSDGDAFDPHGGTDFIDGGAGFDSLHYHLTDGYYGADSTTGISVQFSATVEGSGTVLDPLGFTDTFAGIELVRGTRYSDEFYGGLGYQRFRGYDGADHFDGGAGDDEVDYNDDANYGALGGITADLVAGTVIDPWGNTDTVINIEDIRGTGVTDVIIGNSADNRFRGQAGDDDLSGAVGSDQLEGGLGNDMLDGGEGSDRLFGDEGVDQITGGTGDDFMLGGADADEFILNVGDGNDNIGDFELGTDILVLNGGLTIAATSESDVDGNGSVDTIVELSSGDQIVLLDLNGVNDFNELL